MTREEAINILNEWSGHGPLSGGVCSVFFSATLDEVEEALNMATSALREQPRWISVEERLPEVGQTVLVYCNSRMRTMHVTVGTYMQTYSKVRRCYWSRRIKNVTHWMPLPEQPKEEV